MEYEKKLISLYENISLKGLPLGFIEIEKRAEKCILKVNLYKHKQGWLFIYLKEKCLVFDLSKHKEFIFNDEFFNQNEYLFCIKNKTATLFGLLGKIEDIETKLQRIDAKFLKLEKEKEQLYSQDKNLIVDNIMLKMFGFCSTLFFEQTKKQLSCLFAHSEREKLLESQVAFSKFVKTENEGDVCYAGIVYKNNSAYAVGVGHKENFDDLTLKSGNSYQFFALNDSEKQDGGVFMTFRRASDGDLCFV